jgi:hypothetical protein
MISSADIKAIQDVGGTSRRYALILDHVEDKGRYCAALDNVYSNIKKLCDFWINREPTVHVQVERQEWVAIHLTSRRLKNSQERNNIMISSVDFEAIRQVGGTNCTYILIVDSIPGLSHRYCIAQKNSHREIMQIASNIRDRNQAIYMQVAPQEWVAIDFTPITII